MEICEKEASPAADNNNATMQSCSFRDVWRAFAASDPSLSFADTSDTRAADPVTGHTTAICFQIFVLFGFNSASD